MEEEDGPELGFPFLRPDAVNPSHYRQGKIQPIDFIEANNLGFHEANIVKYTTRWKHKNGVEDLKKAMWYLQRLIELHTIEPLKHQNGN